jgi:hypothetical protein
MRTVAKEAARRGIRVNTLHPGPIDNAFLLEIEDGIGRMAGGVEGTKLLDDMIHLRRHATPDEIARSALYLASDMASFVGRKKSSLNAPNRTCGPWVRPAASSPPVGRAAPSAHASAAWRSTPILQAQLSALQPAPDRRRCPTEQMRGSYLA